MQPVPATAPALQLQPCPLPLYVVFVGTVSDSNVVPDEPPPFDTVIAYTSTSPALTAVAAVAAPPFTVEITFTVSKAGAVELVGLHGKHVQSREPDDVGAQHYESSDHD